jgi:hypothetical protein
LGHSIKGSETNISAAGFRKVAFQVVLAGKDQDMAKAGSVIKELILSICDFWGL